MKNKNDAYRVGISGSYGGLNLGDEAILESIIDGLRSSLPVEITVFSRNAAHTLKSHNADRAVPVRRLSYTEIVPEVERLDLLMIGGGGILFDKEAHIYLREAAIAEKQGIPVMTYAIGAGPLDDPAKQRVVRKTLNKAAAVTVRDRIARRVLEEAGVTGDIVVTADPALLLKPAPLPPDALRLEGLYGKKNLIGFSVREPGPAAPHINKDFYHSLLANTADYLVDRYDAHIVFVPMEPKSRDLQHSHLIISEMIDAERATVLKENYTPGQLLTLMNHFVFALGMRLHFLIFAAMNGVPFVALPYASKVSGFLDALGVEAPPLRQINQGKLIAYIDNAWDKRLALVARMKEVLPELIKQSMRTNEIAVRLLRKGRRGERGTAEKTGRKGLDEKRPAGNLLGGILSEVATPSLRQVLRGPRASWARCPTRSAAAPYLNGPPLMSLSYSYGNVNGTGSFQRSGVPSEYRAIPVTMNKSALQCRKPARSEHGG